MTKEVIKKTLDKRKDMDIPEIHLINKPVNLAPTNTEVTERLKVLVDLKSNA